MADFRKLRVWRAAQELAIDANRVASHMHGARSASLSDQLARAAISVPSNIVEGSAHTSPREFARFLRYSLASATEVEGHALLARDLGMINDKDSGALIDRVVDVRKMLHGLLKKLPATPLRNGKRATENDKAGDG